MNEQNHPPVSRGMQLLNHTPDIRLRDQCLHSAVGFTLLHHIYSVVKARYNLSYFVHCGIEINLNALSSEGIGISSAPHKNMS